jgi:two-component system NtrC family sensor kinase
VRQTERCRDIVKSLLEFSRQSKEGTESVDLNEIARDTYALVGSQSLFFNVAVVMDLDPDLPRIMADRSQLQQVFMNLFVNAAQAMQEEGRITVKSSYSRQDGHVVVRVSDTGHGIDKQHIARIFDPFFTTKEDGRGTGLGLSIAYGIVTQHGGTITVDSEQGKGTTFSMRFPAV